MIEKIERSLTHLTSICVLCDMFLSITENDQEETPGMIKLCK